MSRQTLKTMTKNYCKGVNLLLLIPTLLTGGGCNDSENAQSMHTAQRVNSEEPKTSDGSLSAIESLVAPVALYPDPLLAEVLIAATYPPEIAKAARRLETGPGEDAGGKDADASVQRLAHLPPVIIMMNEHPQWTVTLGDAFLAQPEALLDAVQSLRQRAQQSGFLKDSAAQKVSQAIISAAGVNAGKAPSAEDLPSEQAATREAIYIQPAAAKKIRVPLYDPATAFSAALAPQPADAGTAFLPQQSEQADPGDAYPVDFYPAYQASAETGDNGAAIPAFSAGGAVDGVPTWGLIDWSSPGGYRIKHRYGNLTDCNNFEDCWLRSGDNGYRYVDELAIHAGEGGNADAGSVWRHDPRHRRGLDYGPEAAKRLGVLGPPPLAGQRLSADLPPLRERGFDSLDNAESAGEGEAENFPAEDFLSRRDAAFTALSGLADFNAGGRAEMARGRESRDRGKAAGIAQGSVERIAAAGRSAGKPAATPAPDFDASHELQLQQQRRETALSGVFESFGGNAALIKLFSARGAQSRSRKTPSERGAAANALPHRAPEAAD
jgi:hypothetical protein